MSFPTQLKGKVIAITGAASGIGLATTKLLAARGASLSLADLQEEGLAKLKAELSSSFPGTKVLINALDVRNYAQVESWIKRTVTELGSLDGAANLAGVIPKSIGVGLMSEQDFDEWDFVLDVNLKGVMHCLRAQLGAIATQGSIVNASSIGGLTGRPRNGSYAASKHAVLGLSRTAAKEFGPLKGVRVNAICPGRIETPMSSNAFQLASSGGIASKYQGETVEGVALQRLGQPEEVAELIAFLLSDQSSYITGTAISIDGGWNC